MDKFDGLNDGRRGSRLDRKHGSKRSVQKPRLLAVLAGIALISSVVLVGLLASPIRDKQAQVLPVAKDTESFEKQSETSQEHSKETQEEVDRLDIEVKEIKGVEVKVIEIAEPALNEQDNLHVQGLVMDFVRAQYAGDLRKLKSLSTPDFAKTIDSMPSEFLREKGGNVNFGSITSVAQEGEDLLVFVRISDTKTSAGSEYQENFMIKKVDGKYLVNNMETDA